MAERWLRAVGAHDDGGPPGGDGEDGVCLCDQCFGSVLGYGPPDGRYAFGGGGDGGGTPGRLRQIAHELETLSHEWQPPAPRTVTVRELPHEAMLDWLARVVGGPEALARLDARPLPTGEELDLTEVPGWVREHARVVDEHVQLAFAHQLVGPELLTACRRLLARAAEAGVFEGWRATRPEQAAAAIVHCTAKANGLTWETHGFSMKTLLEGLGVQGYPTHRSRRIATLLAGPEWPHGRRPREAPEVYVLGDADLLLSSFRRDLVIYRDLAERLRPGD